MTRPGVGIALVSSVLACAGVPAVAAGQVDRPQLIQAMKANCFSQHGNDAPQEKAKCDCYARTFVGSLTDAEIAVPQRSAAINAKLAAARHACHFGDF